MRRIKVTPEGKLQAAKECTDGKISTSEQARRFGVGRTRVREWVQRYKAQGDSAFFDACTNKAYSDELKAQVIEKYLLGKGFAVCGRNIFQCVTDLVNNATLVFRIRKCCCNGLLDSGQTVCT